MAANQVLETDVCLMFVGSESISGDFCPSLNDYGLAKNIVGIVRTKDCTFHKQNSYASHGLGA